MDQFSFLLKDLTLVSRTCEVMQGSRELIPKVMQNMFSLKLSSVNPKLLPPILMMRSCRPIAVRMKMISNRFLISVLNSKLDYGVEWQALKELKI
jgi:hypothetical protein